jgi:hypothetical protein
MVAVKGYICMNDKAYRAAEQAYQVLGPLMDLLASRSLVTKLIKWTGIQ